MEFRQGAEFSVFREEERFAEKRGRLSKTRETDLNSNPGPAHPVVVKRRRFESVGRWGAFLSVVLLLLPSPARAVPSCDLALAPPVSGEAVRRFSPAHSGGHWGVDLASPWSGTVRAPVSGTVTFAGRVAGRMSVTIAPKNRLRVSLSYLSSVWVSAGQWIEVGGVLGRSGADHGLSAVHVSLRVDGRYVDPEPALACGRRTSHPWGKLRLVSNPSKGR